MSDLAPQKQAVKQVFDTIAPGYDNAALRFFPFCADAMVALLKPRPGQKILDVATGTGAVAIALAQTLRQQGRVIGIDMSEAMIEKAISNVEKMALHNVDFFTMDAEAVEFKTDYFDHTVCSFGLFFLPNMEKALKSWRRVTKPGGKILFSCFNENSFQPLRQIFIQSLQDFGVETHQAAFSSDRLADAKVCEDLLLSIGLNDVSVQPGQLGYHLHSANDWWDVLWNSGSRRLIEQIDPADLGRFKIQHLAQIEKMATDRGIWMDVDVLLCIGAV